MGTADARDAAVHGLGFELEEGCVLDEAAPSVRLVAREVGAIAEQKQWLSQGVPADQRIGTVKPHEINLVPRERRLEVRHEAQRIVAVRRFQEYGEVEVARGVCASGYPGAECHEKPDPVPLGNLCQCCRGPWPDF